MKRLALAASTLTVLALAAAPAFAQNATGVTDSDSMVVTANIPTVCTVDAPADLTLANFLVNGSGGSLGDVAILCNDPDGFTLTTTSANPSGSPVEGSAGGLLVPTDSSADSSIAYRVAINGNTLFGQPKTAGNLSPGGAADFVLGKNLPASYISSGIRNRAGNGAGVPFAGVYQDTITFQVVSN